MKIKIERSWYGDLEQYKEVLAKYNPSYVKEENGDYYALIEISDLKELFLLASQLKKRLIINCHSENEVEIYDGYIE